MRHGLKDLRRGAPPGLVVVFQLVQEGEKVFKGYQTPDGKWCDEQGYPLGEVTFKTKGGKG